MGGSRHCSEEQDTLIKTLTGERKMYEVVQKIMGSSAKMISNVLKWKSKLETHGRKPKATTGMDGRTD